MMMNGQLQTNVNVVNIQNGLATQINAKVRHPLRDVDFDDFSIFDLVHPEMGASWSQQTGTSNKSEL